MVGKETYYKLFDLLIQDYQVETDKNGDIRLFYKTIGRWNGLFSQFKFNNTTKILHKNSSKLFLIAIKYIPEDIHRIQFMFIPWFEQKYGVKVKNMVGNGMIITNIST